MDNETGYLSGPSGTFNLQISLYEMMINSKNIEDKQLYLQSIYAYIVGTGLHSTHEVLGPAQDTMGLIPGYVAEKPSYEGEMSPPNFNAFFEMAANNDPGFQQRLDTARGQVAEFYDSIYKKFPEIYSEKILLEELIDKYGENEHDKYATPIEILLKNGVHTAGKDDAHPLILAMWRRKENLIDLISKQVDFMSKDQNKEIYNTYQGVESIQPQNCSRYFNFTFDPQDMLFKLEAEWDDAIDDNYDLSEYQKEINQFLTSIGVNNIVAEDMQQYFMGPEFTAEEQKLLKEHFSQKLKKSTDLTSELNKADMTKLKSAQELTQSQAQANFGQNTSTGLNSLFSPLFAEAKSSLSSPKIEKADVKKKHLEQSTSSRKPTSQHSRSKLLFSSDSQMHNLEATNQDRSSSIVPTSKDVSEKQDALKNKSPRKTKKPF
tara:strand:- start:12172 stop:13470 length:1299 start_codon:yes stop_codon:yes gene_type:complete